MEPLDDASVKTLAERYAALVSELEIPVGEPLLVLPTAEFFPDRFNGDQESVERLAARMQGYAGLENVALETRLVGDGAVPEAGGCGPSGCGSGACSTEASAGVSEPRLERTPDGWMLRVPQAELGSSIVLTARLAAALGAVALAEGHPRGLEVAADPAQGELAATALGFGVLLLEASYLYAKSCGGPNVRRATTLGCDELAVLFALSAAREGHSIKRALAELGTTQRALVSDAWLVVNESPGLVKLLQTRPERAAQGGFNLRDRGSVWSRLFGRSRRPKDRVAEALTALEQGASVDELAELLGPASSVERR